MSHSLNKWDDGEPIYLAGSIEQIEVKQTRKPSRNGVSEYANFRIRNPTGVTRCTIWPEDYQRWMVDIGRNQASCCLYGLVDKRGRTPEFIAQRFVTLNELATVANTVRR